MPHRQVKTFRDLPKLKLKHKAEIQITRAGGLCKARWAGSANCVFGSTPEEAASRLRKISTAIYRDNSRNSNERNFKAHLDEPGD
jgi:hypothetical protein